MLFALRANGRGIGDRWNGIGAWVYKQIPPLRYGMTTT